MTAGQGNPLPERLGHYRIEQELGRGGMGIVYAAMDERLQRRVALKVVATRELGDAAAAKIDELLLEAQVAARCHHDGLVTVFGFENFGDHALIAMELLDGSTLAQALRRGMRFTPKDAVQLVHSVVTAVVVAHQEGVVHRDIKPANLMVLNDGRIKLLDFGVAVIRGVKPRQIAGTPAYMPPEQARGEQITSAADVYALGAVLFELLTGQPPYPGATVPGVASRPDSELPQLLRMDSGAHSPFGKLHALLARALSARPEARYQDAAALRDALELHGARGGTRIDSSSVHHERGAHGKRRAAIALASGLAVLVLAVAGIALVALSSDGRRSRQFSSDAGGGAMPGASDASSVASENAPSIGPTAESRQPPALIAENAPVVDTTRKLAPARSLRESVAPAPAPTPAVSGISSVAVPIPAIPEFGQITVLKGACGAVGFAVLNSSTGSWVDGFAPSDGAEAPKSVRVEAGRKYRVTDGGNRIVADTQVRANETLTVYTC